MIGALLVVLTFVNAMYYKDYQTALLRGIYLKDGLSYLEANRWSVPIVSDWNGDGKKDLLIGNRTYGKDRKINRGYVSFYENMGTDGSPSFSGSVYIRSCRETCTSLTVAADGWQGSYPSVVDWNSDGNHDLLVGDAAGNILLFLNTTDNSNPALYLTSLPLEDGTALHAGERATPVADDWNGDGNIDILTGSMDGTIKIFINKGTASDPRFAPPYHLQLAGKDFDAGSRSAPRIHDWNNDGLKDILVGELEGYVYFLKNVGTNKSPEFVRAEKLFLNNGDFVHYPGRAPRSRLSVTDWNNDGSSDLLIGGADGKIQLYLSASQPHRSLMEYFTFAWNALKESAAHMKRFTKEKIKSVVSYR
jgi:uncharacterized protein (DUF2141 family)